MPKLMFFIGSLVSGGKERRFVELLSYLKNNTDVEILVVATGNENHFPIFKELKIELELIKKNNLYSGMNIPLRLYQISKKYKPDILHTWGRMQNFYSLPIRILTNTHLINGQITNSSPYKKVSDKLIDRLNFKFSDIIVANSQAGIEIYNPPPSKSLVIPNGLNPNRFQDLPDIHEVKRKYGIKTKFAVIMVATFSKNKDYTYFLNLAKFLSKQREDVTFVAVGTFHKNENHYYNNFLQAIQHQKNIIATGVIFDVEALVNACDIGILFSNPLVHGEGLSNAILEYMALGKPVIANNAGGTKEIVKHLENGYLVNEESPQEVAQVVSDWLDNDTLRYKLGQIGKKMIEQSFTLDKMGAAYSKLYRDVLVKK
jgi:glycosyltransferase involved in cell wall biosynthesis